MLFIYFLPILGTNIFNSIFYLFNIQRFCQICNINSSHDISLHMICIRYCV